MRNRATSGAGFSLLELVMVTAIIAILAAIAVPRYSASLARYRVQAAAARIAADLELARNRARLASASQAVVFAVGSSEYVITGVPGMDRPAEPYKVALWQEPYRARLVAAGFAGGEKLTFDGFGFPTGGGAVVVQVGGFQKTVVVDDQTGQVSVQ